MCSLFILILIRATSNCFSHVKFNCPPPLGAYQEPHCYRTTCYSTLYIVNFKHKKNVLSKRVHGVRRRNITGRYIFSDSKAYTRNDRLLDDQW